MCIDASVVLVVSLLGSCLMDSKSSGDKPDLSSMYNMGSEVVVELVVLELVLVVILGLLVVVVLGFSDGLVVFMLIGFGLIAVIAIEVIFKLSFSFAGAELIGNLVPLYLGVLGSNVGFLVAARVAIVGFAVVSMDSILEGATVVTFVACSVTSTELLPNGMCSMRS